MKRALRNAILAASVAVAFATTGCGDQDSRITLVPVEGTATENGKPIEGALITFVPEGGNHDLTTGVDRTGPGGSFRAMYRNRLGLAPGKYKVVISKAVETAGKHIPEAFKDMPYQAQRAGLLKEQISRDYRDPKKTPLSLEVSDKGEKDLVFDIKDLRRSK